MRTLKTAIFVAVVLLSLSFRVSLSQSAAQRQTAQKQGNKYTIAPNSSKIQRDARLLALINKLDAPKASKRFEAEKILTNIATKNDISTLEKALKNANSAEQRLRLRNVLISLGWIPPEYKNKLKENFKLLESANVSARKQAIIEILRVPNGHLALKKHFASIKAGKLYLSIRIGAKIIEIGKTTKIFFTLKNIDKKGFFINAHRFKGKLQLDINWRSLFNDEVEQYSNPSEHPSDPFWWNEQVVNDFAKFRYIKPNEELQLEQEYVNIARPGKVEITGVYKNTASDFEVIKYSETGAVVYSQLIPINAWQGKLKARAYYISVLPLKALELGRIACELSAEKKTIVAGKPKVETFKLSVSTTVVNYNNHPVKLDLSRIIFVIADSSSKIITVEPVKVNKLKVLTLKARSEAKIKLSLYLAKRASTFSIQLQCVSIIPGESVDVATNPVKFVFKNKK